MGAARMIAAAVAAAIGLFALSTQISPQDAVGLIKAKMDNFEEVLLAAGPMGPVYVFGVYLVTTIFMLPLWGFHMTCGWVYGTFWSSLLIATTQAFCAGAAFSTSRYVVGPYIRGFLVRKYGKKYDAIDSAVSKEGLKITLLLRLSPIVPFGINNYLCGVTKMKLWEFVLGTWLGVLPGTTAYCNLGAMGKTALDGGTTPLQKAVMALGVVAALAVIKLLSDLATKALKDAGIDDDDSSAASKAADASSSTVKANGVNGSPKKTD
mmetsp:Transcript_16616/g.47303  ORF Transcript_16616/g.47303 Transcript_16616/m.47303 type:complete len:265 (+) Transcript_16616:53-847(+)